MELRYLSGMEVSASGLEALRRQMDVSAENLANLNTTRTDSGDPYRRQVVQFASALEQQVYPSSLPVVQAPLVRTNEVHYPQGSGKTAPVVEQTRRVAASIVEDPSEFPTIFDPSHPDADENGLVRMPNVDMAQEMVHLMTAARAYEANIAALQAARAISDASLDLAR